MVLVIDFGLLILTAVLVWWVSGVAQSYAAVLDQYKVADWRTFCASLSRVIHVRHSTVWTQPASVGLFVLMSCYGVASHHMQGGLSGVWLYQYCVAWLLALMALIDLRTGLLIDVIGYPLLVAGLVMAISGESIPLMQALCGAVLAYVLLSVARAVISKCYGKTALGRGDIKLFVALGLWTGTQGVFTILLLANALVLVLALAVARRHDGAAEYPFGPFILVATVIFWLQPSVQ